MENARRPYVCLQSNLDEASTLGVPSRGRLMDIGHSIV